jgi:hypothetical protein
MNRLGITALALIGLCPAVHALAQEPVVGAGTRLRVRTAEVGAAGDLAETRGTRFVGHVDRVSADSLWIHLDSADGPLLSIDRATIQELEVSSGRKRNAGKGALWGGGVGLALGILGAIAVDDCGVSINDDFFDFCDGEEATIILGSTLTLAGVGALVGLLVTSERWVEIPPASLTLRGEDGQLGLGIEVRLRL